MRLVRRNGNSMEDVVTRALHLRLRLRFASLILILSRHQPFITLATLFSRLILANLISLLGILYSIITSYRYFLFMLWNAYNNMCRGILYSWHFSIICHATKICSMVLHSSLKSHCCFSRIRSAYWLIFPRMTVESILYAISSRIIHECWEGIQYCW